VRILLSGFMGAGKTTVGRLLAERLGVPFRDLDQMVEARSQKSVRELFETAGEEEFRRLERSALGEACALDRVVVALGGGTLSNPESFEIAKTNGVVVWLNPPFAVIARRVGARGKADRPLFRDEVSAFDLYRQRLPVYRKADLVVDVGPEEQAAEVAARLALLIPHRPQERTCTT
jgi:shikimate kinase